MYNKKCLECFCCSGRPPKRIPSEYSRLIRQCFRETASGRQHITVPDPQKKQQLGRIISIMKKLAKEHTGKYKLVKYGDPVSYIIEAEVPFCLLDADTLSSGDLFTLLETGCHFVPVNENCLKIFTVLSVSDIIGL